MKKQAKIRRKPIKTIISADGAEGFFARGKVIAKLADQGKLIPAEHIVNFDSAEEMLSILTKERRRLMTVLRQGAASISDIIHHTHRDRAAVAKDLKLLEYSGLVTMKEEINPGHGRHKIICAISRYPIRLQATI